MISPTLMLRHVETKVDFLLQIFVTGQKNENSTSKLEEKSFALELNVFTILSENLDH